MTDPQIAWAAGLFEGEGCISNSRIRQGKVCKQLSLEMTDLDIVERFRKVVGVDNKIISRVRKDNGNCKPIYLYRIQAHKDIQRVLSSFLPFFGLRRAYTALNTLDQIELD